MPSKSRSKSKSKKSKSKSKPKYGPDGCIVGKKRSKYSGVCVKPCPSGFRRTRSGGRRITTCKSGLVHEGKGGRCVRACGPMEMRTKDYKCRSKLYSGKRSYNVWSREQDILLRNLHEDGEPCRSISKKLGVTSTACRNRLRILFPERFGPDRWAPYR